MQHSQEIHAVKMAQSASPGARALDVQERKTLDGMFNELAHLKESVGVLPQQMLLMQDRLNIIGKNTDDCVANLPGIFTRLDVAEMNINEHSKAVYNTNTHDHNHGDGGGCGDGCGHGGFTTKLYRPFPPGVPLPPGSSGDGDSFGILRAVIGGNGRCHCEHVKDLLEKVEALERAGRRSGRAPGDRGDDPLQHTGWQPSRPEVRAPPNAKLDKDGKHILPLTLREPLGAIKFKDRAIFDEKLAGQDDYRYGGVKGGLALKGKVERHVISQPQCSRRYSRGPRAAS